MTSRSLFLCIFVAALIPSCEMDQRPEYSIVLLNTGSNEIDDAAVKYDQFTSIGGVLLPNAEKGQSGVKVGLPDVVTVVWTTIDGKHHEQRVPVRGRRPFRKLTVTINGDTVTTADTTAPWDRICLKVVDRLRAIDSAMLSMTNEKVIAALKALLGEPAVENARAPCVST